MRKFWAGAFACVVVAAFATAPARAQDPAQNPATTSTTAAPETTTTAPTTVPTTAAPTSTTVRTGSAPPVDTTLPGDTTTTTGPAEDPAAGGDAPSEAPPVDNLTIPPREPEPALAPGGFYADQPALAGHPGRLVRVTERTARSRASETQATLDAAIIARDMLAARQVQLHEDLGRLAVEEREAITALEQAQLLLEERAADAYIRGSLGPVSVLLSSTSATDYYHRRELLQAVQNADEDAVDEFRRARAAVDEQQAQTAIQLTEVAQQLVNAEQAVVAATFEHDLASRELAVFMAGGSVVIHGFVFPVAGPTNFIDSFGFPRMTGTPYEHWHEGTDVFADAGTELVAVERGVVTRMGSNVLGGITVWMRGESGVSYYYAHLSGYAPGVSVGLVVEAATVLGYVGNTGNARTTPPHLHFEVHPGGGQAINPYPLLSVAVDQPQPPPIRLEGAVAPTG